MVKRSTSDYTWAISNSYFSPTEIHHQEKKLCLIINNSSRDFMIWVSCSRIPCDQISLLNLQVTLHREKSTAIRSKRRRLKFLYLQSYNRVSTTDIRVQSICRSGCFDRSFERGVRIDYGGSLISLEGQMEGATVAGVQSGNRRSWPECRQPRTGQFFSSPFFLARKPVRQCYLLAAARCALAISRRALRGTSSTHVTAKGAVSRLLRGRRREIIIKICQDARKIETTRFVLSQCAGSVSWDALWNSITWEFLCFSFFSFLLGHGQPSCFAEVVTLKEYQPLFQGYYMICVIKTPCSGYFSKNGPILTESGVNRDVHFGNLR